MVRVVVIGCGPAGFSCAYFTKLLKSDLDVVIVRREEKSIIPCAVPYIFKTIGDIHKNLLPDEPLRKLGIDIKIGEVKGIDPNKKLIKLSSGNELSYDYLVLALGSKPVELPIPGTDLENVFYVYKDCNYLKKLADCIKDVDHITIIGGGFIGVEFADELSKLGKKITIIELLPHCLQLNFDIEFCKLAEEELRKLGVEIKTNSKVVKILGDKKVKAVKLANGEELSTDLVINAIGARANTDLVKGILKFSERNTIAVDEYLRTSIPNIYAIGDCAEKRDFLTGKFIPVMLASVASMEGKVVASNITGIGIQRIIKGIVPIFSTKVGDLVFGAAGYIESRARNEGLDIVVGNFETIDKHPGVLPGAKKVIVKLIALRKSQRVIGCEICGGLSVSEMVNLIGGLIQKGITLSELTTLQIGTHPHLTASPIMYPIVGAAFNALKKIS